MELVGDNKRLLNESWKALKKSFPPFSAIVAELVFVIPEFEILPEVKVSYCILLCAPCFL